MGAGERHFEGVCRAEGGSSRVVCQAEGLGDSAAVVVLGSDPGGWSLTVSLPPITVFPQTDFNSILLIYFIHFLESIQFSFHRNNFSFCVHMPWSILKVNII